MRGLPQKQNARRAYKIRLCGHLRRYKKIVKKTYIIYYEIIEYDLKPRPVVMENIEKVINCGDPSYGGAMYICTHCKNWKFVPFRCHVVVKHFCNTYG